MQVCILLLTDGRQDIPSTFPNFVHICLIFPYLILQAGSWHTRESIGYDGTWMFKAYGVCLDFTCLVWWRNTTQYQYKHSTTNSYKLSQNNYNPSVWSARERTAISTTLDTLEIAYTGSMDVRLHLLAIPRVFNYRLITAYLLLRVNLDRIMHARWDFDASSARTRRVSALDKHQNWSASAVFCLNSRAQSKYAVVNLIHTRRKQTFLSFFMW